MASLVACSTLAANCGDPCEDDYDPVCAMLDGRPVEFLNHCKLEIYNCQHRTGNVTSGYEVLVDPYSRLVFLFQETYFTKGPCPTTPKPPE